LFGTPRPTPHYFLFLGLALAAILVAWQLVHSRVGVYLRAIRDDEEAAAVMGVDTFKWKRVIFAVSAIFAAVAGGFQGHYVRLLSPTPMKFNEIAIIIIMVIIGGLRTFWGPVVGAIFVEILSEALRPWGEIRMVLFALLVIIVARAYPAGLVGAASVLRRRMRALVPRGGGRRLGARGGGGWAGRGGIVAARGPVTTRAAIGRCRPPTVDSRLRAGAGR